MIIVRTQVLSSSIKSNVSATGLRIRISLSLSLSLPPCLSLLLMLPYLCAISPCISCMLIGYKLIDGTGFRYHGLRAVLPSSSELIRRLCLQYPTANSPQARGNSLQPAPSQHPSINQSISMLSQVLNFSAGSSLNAQCPTLQIDLMRKEERSESKRKKSVRNII